MPETLRGTQPPRLLWTTAAALTLVHWGALILDANSLGPLTKLPPMVAIIAAALVSGLLHRRWGTATLTGLILGLTGDSILLIPGETPFLLGLVAFLLGHVAYLVAFRQHGLSWWRGVWVGVGALVGCLVYSGALVPTLWREGGMASAGPVALYMTVIGLMSVGAWATGRWVVGLGASLFVLSDTVLALNAFLFEDGLGPLAVMVPYLVGQGLIAWGMSLPD